MHEFHVGIATRLRDSRLASKFTQQAVAQHLGVTRQAVSSWECGGALPAVDELMALGLLYGQSLDYIVYGVRNLPTALSRLLDGRGEETRPPG